MLYFKIGLRNLARQKRRSFLLGGAIVFGVLIITLLNGIAMTSAVNIRTNLSSFLAGHIFITGKEKLPTGRTVSVIHDQSGISAAIKKLDKYIRVITRRSKINNALLINGQETAYAKIDGIDWSAESYMTDKIRLAGGSWKKVIMQENSIVLSETITENLGLELGDIVLCQMTTITGQENVVEFRLEGIMPGSGGFFALSAYANITFVNRCLNLQPGEYTDMGILFKDSSRIDELGNRFYAVLEAAHIPLFGRYNRNVESVTMESLQLQGKWKGVKYQFLTLNEIMSDIIEMLDGISRLGFIVFVILFIIIMFGITNTYRMVVYERVREIGTMRALGMKKSLVSGIFYSEAFFLASLSYLTGMLAGLFILCCLASVDFGIGSDLYLFLDSGYPGFRVNGSLLLLNAGIVIVFSMFAVHFPARKAANLTPAAAQRKYT